MSMIPNDGRGPSAEAPAQETASAPARAGRRRLFSAAVASFTLAIGVFLVVFPWMDIWNLNYVQSLSPKLENVWDDPYFRGAVTGLGLANIYLAALEVARLVRRK